MERRADYILHKRSVYLYNYSQTAKLSILKIFCFRRYFSTRPVNFENIAIHSRQSTLSTGSGKISGRTVLLIQSESSYANVLRNIRREISRIPFAFSKVQISTRSISSTHANCVHIICEVENRTNLHQSSPTSTDEIAILI